MSDPKMAKAMGYIDDALVSGAVEYKRTKKKNTWIKWGAMAACLCLVVGSAIKLTQNGSSTIPDPAPVQVINPMMTVATVEEMEQYLDFDVPVLDKEVESYVVIVLDSYPTVGQIDYADGSEFRIQYGSGDISGFYGSTPDEVKNVDGIKVECYKSEDITYAIWEENGYTLSYSFADGAEIETIIQQLK